MTHSARLLVSVVTLSFVAGVASAQQKGAPADPVSITFRALTVSGSPVIDLTAADITLKVAGKERAIRNFDRLRLGDAAPMGSGLLPAPFSTNGQPVYGPRDAVLVIDDQSIAPGDESRVVAAFEQYLASVGANDRVGLITIQDRGLNVSLTNDRDQLRAGIKKLVGHAPSVETADDSACRTRRVLDAISSISGGFPAGTAPVTVMLLTTGVTAPGNSTTMSRMGSSASAPTSVCEVQPRDYQQAERATLASAINLYVVAPALAPSPAMQQGLENLAGISGNALMGLVRNNDSDMARIARENVAWYRASFVPEPGERTGDVQRVELASKRTGVQAIGRAQLLIPKMQQTSQPKAPKDLLRESRGYRDFEFRAAVFSSMEPGSDKVKVMVFFEPLDAGVTVSAASVGLFDPKGKLSVQGTAEAGNLTRTPAVMAVLAAPGPYRVRVAAVDSTGRAGTVDADVTLALTDAAPLKIGSLIPGVADGGAFSGRLVFSKEPAVIGYVEVYGVPAKGVVTSSLEVSSAMGQLLGTADTKVRR